MKKNWIEVVIHIIFWLSTAWLITSGFSVVSQDIEVIDGVETVHIVRDTYFMYKLLCIGISMIAFYMNTWLIFRWNRARTGKSPIWYPALVLLIVLLVIYGMTEVRLIRHASPIPKELAFGIAIFYFALSIAYSLAKVLIYNNRRQQALLIAKKQAELTLLRNQLQPHFLFNAINNLLSLVHPSDNPKLVHSFDRLSQLLRYVIEESGTDKVSIAKDIEFLKNYIQLQLLRFNEGEVDIDFQVNGPYDNQQVEPGLFIVFVENAFKYGTEPEKRARIEIAFDLSERNSIRFQTRNKVLMGNREGVGTGIEATRKRLDLIYPDAHELSISQAEDFIVKLTIYTA
jgi:sensor histidine kinase YesM